LDDDVEHEVLQIAARGRHVLGEPLWQLGRRDALCGGSLLGSLSAAA
jgi:hypothetical protein